jgi:hypothetical protein
MINNGQVMNMINKCADAIELGNSFGKYARLKKNQFAILMDERKNDDGK